MRRNTPWLVVFLAASVIGDTGPSISRWRPNSGNQGLREHKEFNEVPSSTNSGN